MSADAGAAGNVADAVRVVYIAGAKNCGSTLLDAILGNAPGARSLGEVGGFHRFEPGAPCACQAAPCDVCPLVMGCVDSQGGRKEFNELSQLPLKERRAHWLLLRTGSRQRYAQMADVVFAGAAATTHSRVLIDSSKNATRAAALVYDSRFDVRVVHVVRDGRGYLQSRKTRAAVDGKRHFAPVAMVSWLLKNVLIGSVLGPRVGAGRYMICRYEDLIGDSGPTLDRICTFAGLDPTGLLERATTGQGVVRRQLFEPARRTDYRQVRLEPGRLTGQRETGWRNNAFWSLGGFLSARWGYDKQQSYLSSAR